MSVVAVARSPDHTFTKCTTDSITLVKGLGVEGDAHFGESVQHRSRLHIEPPPKNLRQVHLISAETLEERNLDPGAIGENITTTGLDLLEMSAGTRMVFRKDQKVGGDAPTIVLAGLRNPCPQIEKYRKGLQETFIQRGEGREIVRRLAGVMATVEIGGEVTPGMNVVTEEPEDYIPLTPV